MGRSLTLAGDIGGTKAYLGIFRSDGEGICCMEEGRFPTARYSGVSELLLSFIETSGHRPERVVVGVPGPVRHPSVRPVNLPWTIDPVEIEDGGMGLCYRGGDGTGRGKEEVAELTKALTRAGIDYTGIDVRESSLEEIFVGLVKDGDNGGSSDTQEAA